jgi:hypothetical protein
MTKVTVQYAPGQIDDEGSPVGTQPFTVEFHRDPEVPLIEDIAETGDVQFDWVLVSVEEADA